MLVDELLVKIANQIADLESFKKSYPVLYHKTPIDRAELILQTNSLKGLANSISMSRNKDVDVKLLVPSDWWVRFSFDANSLLKGRRFVTKRPYNDFANDLSAPDEQEERIFDKRHGIEDLMDKSIPQIVLNNINDSILRIDMERAAYNKLLDALSSRQTGNQKKKVYREDLITGEALDILSEISLTGAAQLSELYEDNGSLDDCLADSPTYEEEIILKALKTLIQNNLLPKGYDQQLFAKEPGDIRRELAALGEDEKKKSPLPNSDLKIVFEHPKFRVVDKF